MVMVGVLNYVVLMIGVLIGVAFFTLLERKVLGSVQIRKGPDKVGYTGILQPFSDAVKLFMKEGGEPSVSNFWVYYMTPISMLFISLVLWMSIPYLINMSVIEMSVLFFFCCVSVGVYPLMWGGWSSNSKYSLLGGLRAVAQTISYEVSMILILLSFIFLSEGYDMIEFKSYQSGVWFIFLMVPLGLVWFVSSLAETSRTPFDFSEGESELVSGFNTEYGGGGFALIFMAEYSSILFMSGVFSIMFLGGALISMSFYLKVLTVGGLFLWVRGTLPRFRYDKLMWLAWKSFLPLSLSYLLFFMGLKILLI